MSHKLRYKFKDELVKKGEFNDVLTNVAGKKQVHLEIKCTLVFSGFVKKTLADIFGELSRTTERMTMKSFKNLLSYLNRILKNNFCISLLRKTWKNYFQSKRVMNSQHIFSTAIFDIVFEIINQFLKNNTFRRKW